MRPTLARALLLAVGVLLEAAPPSVAQATPSPEDYTLRLEYLWWSPQPTGELQKGVSEIEGTLIDLEDDLGVAASSANALRAALRVGGSWKLRGSWSPLDFRGTAIASRPFIYGTTVVRAGDEVSSSLKGNYVTSEVEWDFVGREQGFLGLLAGVKFFDVDVLVLDVDTSSRVAETERLPVPVVGLAGRVYVGGRVSLEAELSGLPAGDRGHVFEMLLAGRIHLLRRLAATAGWHKLAVEGRDDRDFFSINLSQWTLGVEISL
jgi:hypothetical protein